MQNTGTDPSDHSPTTTTERHRLPQDRYWLTEEISDLFPVQAYPSTPPHILDITCGPQGWAPDPVDAYLRTHEGNVSPHQLLMEYARALYFSHTRENDFQFLFDVLSGMRESKSSRSFDIVSLSFIESYTPSDGFDSLLQHAAALCRPGGWLRWQEGDVPQTTSSACTQFFALATQALTTAKRGFASQERKQDLISVMGRRLRDAGCQSMRLIPWRIDVSAGAPAHSNFVQQMRTVISVTQIFLLDVDVVTEEELGQLNFQMEAEFQDRDFQGRCFLYTVWGRKKS